MIPEEFSATSLSEAERLRATRLRNAAKQRQQLRSRSCLRTILAAYLHLTPEAIPLREASSGKPYLEAAGWHFNLAHSGAWGCLAICSDGPLGVDLERIDPRLDHERLVSRFYPSWKASPAAAISPARRRRSFYRHWTRYEALGKRDAVGLSRNASLDGSRDPRVRHFYLAPGYVACVAAATPFLRVARYTLAPA